MAATRAEAPQRTRSEQADPDPDPDREILIVGRRRPKPLDDTTPTRQLSEEQISTYGAMSVGDLIRRLQDEHGGRPFSVVVNGRRLSSIADINELPAEALKSIQLYAPGEGGKFGFNPTDRLLNVTLKQRFRSLSVDIGGQGPTDGGGWSVQGTPRMANIAGDSRQNGSLNVRAGQRLLARQRSQLPGDPPADPDRTLLPGSRTVVATLGASRPLGNGSLDLTFSGNASRIVAQRTGTIRQLDNARSASVATGYNLSTGKLFGFVSISVNAGSSRSHILGICPGRDRPCALQDIGTTTLGAGLLGSLTGKIVPLPAGDLRFDMTLQRNTTRTRNRDFSGDRGQLRSGYASTNGRVSITVPLVPTESSLDFLGKLEITPALSYDAVDAGGGALGTNLGVNWLPSTAWQFNASIGRRATAPSNDQLNAPLRIIVGATVYDYRVQAMVPVEQIVGGSALAPSSIRDLQIGASYDGTIGKTQFNANVSYSGSTTQRPPFSVTEPSRFFERIFPERFSRDAAGTLIRVDTRAINAVRQSSAMLSGTVNLSGRLGGADPRSVDGISWNASFGGQRQLRESLLFTPDAPAIDMLRTPLSLSTGTRGRQQWNANLRLNTSRWGGTLSTDLDSGLRSTAFGDASSGVRVVPLARASTSIFFLLPKPASGQAGAGMKGRARLELEVRNIFNARPQIQTFADGKTVRLNPMLIDPLGRVVALTLRLS